MACCVNIIIIPGQHFAVVQSKERDKVHHKSPKSFREEVNTRVKVNTNLHDDRAYTKTQQSDDNKS